MDRKKSLGPGDPHFADRNDRSRGGNASLPDGKERNSDGIGQLLAGDR
ncbi:MAG: hypothetical protein JO314_09680 [Acidobacteria bacterium]|nr:hypothetical protein [Acidobacteriota bacterium]